MFDRRRFLATTVATCVIPHARTGAVEPAGELRIGLAADAQYADAAPSGQRHYRLGADRLAAAVAEFNRQSVDCCFHLGDLIDRDFGSFARCLRSLHDLRVPCYHVLGNHDFDVDQLDKPRVAARIGLESRYYAIRRGGFRFVLLDGTENSVFAYANDDPRWKAANTQLTQLKGSKASNAQTWNGGIGPLQLDWLLGELNASAVAGERVILMCHYPVFPVNAHNLWNDQQLLEIIDEHSHVVAWLNGHNHAGNYGERNGVHYVTLSGMVEHKKTNAFGVATLKSDRLMLTGFGREPNRDLPFKAT